MIVLGGTAGLFWIAYYLVPRVLVTMTRATPGGKVSFESSLVIGEKILAKADDKDECIVNVFIMDSDGKGVAGKRVVLTGLEKVRANNEVTDSSGQIKYSMTSAVAGQFKVTATVEGVPLSKEVTVTFR